MAIIYYNNDTEINLTDLINIVDDLTSSSSTSALSANQGKALNTIIGNLNNLNTADKSSIVNAINDVIHKTDLLGSEPVGSVLPYCGNSAPPGYYICDGRAISRENNADLFNVIGTTYGSGDGSTTFNLPDLRDRFILGKGTNTDIADVGDNMNIIVDTEDVLTYVILLFVIKAEGTEPATMAESLPVGSVVDFDGDINNIPTGWVPAEDISSITVKRSTDGSAYGDETQIVTFDTVVNQTGGKITLSTVMHEILVLEECDVEISGCYRFGYCDSSKKYVYIRTHVINSEAEETLITLSQQNCTATTLTIAPFITHLSPGTYVSLLGYCDATGVKTRVHAEGTYLTLKEINC